MPDKDGYPTKQELRKVKEWDIDDFTGWFKYIESIWHWDDRARVYRGRNCFGRRVNKAYLSTGGWSGNESIIDAMQNNKNYLWMFTCWKSRRGGHYWFEWS